MKLETVTGRLIDLNDPDPNDIDIEDIAWGLSRMPRFLGQTITLVPYNVAQHSVFVADEVVAGWIDTPSIVTLNEISLMALLHDAAEAYTGDWPSPIKHIPELRPIIKGIEDRLTTAIYTALHICVPQFDEINAIKQADKLAQRIEAHAFMPSRGKDWEGLPNVSLEKLQQFKEPLTSIEAYKLFMTRFEQYRN